MHFALLFTVNINDNTDYLGRNFITVIELCGFYHYPDEITVDALYTVFALNKVCGSENTVKIRKVAFLIVLMYTELIDKAFLKSIVFRSEAEFLIKVFGNINSTLFVVDFKNDIVCHLNDSTVTLFTFKYVIKHRVESIAYLTEFVL